MSATGLAVFDETVQKTNTWLKEIAQALGSDRQRGYQDMKEQLIPRLVESGLKVAFMGKKTFRWEDGGEKHEVEFNYSEDPNARLSPLPHNLGLDPGGGSSRDAEEDDEDEQLRRAIAESEALARAQGHAGSSHGGEASSSAFASGSGSGSGSGSRVGADAWANHHRVYDDDDAELQAALRASLESMPEGFQMPETPPPTRPALPHAPLAVPAALPVDTSEMSSVGETDMETEAETETEEAAAPARDVSMEEMRRKRLARFGAEA